MNIKINTLVYLLLAMCPVFCAADMTATGYADAIVADWNNRRFGDDSPFLLCTSSGQRVPKAIYWEVVDEMFERALSAKPEDYKVLGVLLGILGGYQHNEKFPERLDQNLYAAGRDANPLIRRDVIRALGLMRRDKDGDYLIAALNDTDDEVRGYAVEALIDRPETKSILQKFAQAHGGDKGYEASVFMIKRDLKLHP